MIVAAAAATNALRVMEKSWDTPNVVALGAGAAGIACLKMLIVMGVRHDTIPEPRERLFPGSRLTGSDAVGAARTLLEAVGDGLGAGPIWMGMCNRGHIVTPGVTVRGLLDIPALAGMPVACHA